jgi:hypothetical protein
MIRLLIATLLSVILAEWLELWYRFGATWDPQAFVGATAPYALIALGFHLVLTLVNRGPVWLWWLLGALPGMALEWFAIGNSPWGNPAASQVGMLIFHGSWPIWGRMFDRRWICARQCRMALVWWAGWSLCLIPGFLIPSGEWRYVFFVVLPLGFYAGLAALTLWRGDWAAA